LVTITLLGFVTLYAVAIWLRIFNRMSNHLIHEWLFYPIAAISLIIIIALGYLLPLEIIKL